MAKKEKITYIDDGRTIADMSGVKGGAKLPPRPAYQPRAGVKEQLRTFFGAMRMMLLPMLVVVAAMIAVFLLAYFALS